MNGLYGLLYGSAVRCPDKVFIQNNAQAWTYHETLIMTQYISRYLRQRGVQKGDRIVIFCDNSIQYIAAYFATLRINGVVVPVNPSKMAESFLYIIEKCGPRLILTCDSTAEKLEKIDGVLAAECVNINCLNMADDKFNDQLDDPVEADDDAVILFTSGTTAHPKGVTLTHGNLIANTEAVVDYLRLTCDDSMLMTLPFTYSYGNSVLLTHTLVGASIIIENSTAFPSKVLEGIQKFGVSGFSTVGSYANLILKYIRNADNQKNFFGSLRYMTFAGEATSNDDICFINTNFPHVEVFVMYGQTEASARLSYLRPDLLGCKKGSVGKGLCNVELKVVDEKGLEIKPGALGEIIARGPSIMKGYWGDVQATQDILKNGWLYTGDTATVDEDGYIYIKGRKSDIIKHMGHRISPVEIESVINSYNDIKECAVVESMLDQIPVIKAFIVLNKECQVEAVKMYTNSKLPAYMRPQVFRVIDQLPKTDSGKIKRSMLRNV